MRAVPVGLSLATKPSVNLWYGSVGPANFVWRTPGVVGKSSASVLPATTTFPAASWPTASIVLVPAGTCEKPYQDPPRNVDHRRPLPSALSCATKPLLADRKSTRLNSSHANI